MKIKYGIRELNIDVTFICLKKLLKNCTITIPAGNLNCDCIFGDPVYGTKKKIFITNDEDVILEEYDDLKPIIINVEIKTDLICDKLKQYELNQDELKQDELKQDELEQDKLKQNKLKQDELNNIEYLYDLIKINYGTMKCEKELHKMCINYLTGNEKILEIGGNIGRTTLLIASILNNYNLNNNHNLNDNLNLVTMECHLDTAIKLEENKELNNFNFYVEKSALSKKILIQKGPYETIVSDTLKKDYSYVNLITYEELKNKYNINFDTLIIDCDGGFYDILIDMPEILNDMNLIIMKNEYDRLDKKKYIDGKLSEYMFNKIYTKGEGWGACCNNFYEVWKK